MVEIIIKREIAIATGLDKTTLVVRGGILTDLSNGDLSIDITDTTGRINTYWGSLNESQQTRLLRRCSSEHKSFEEIIEEEMKG